MFVICFKLSSATLQDFLQSMDTYGLLFNSKDKAFRFPCRESAYLVLQSLKIKEQLEITELDNNE